MPSGIRNNSKMPFCPGCSYQAIIDGIARTLDESGLKPFDVTFVSDIGCCGLIDPLLSCHTIHGLHGRVTALAMGVALGLNNPEQKIVAIQGDGGATIGLQHLLEAARLNINMTLVVCNNMVYGMTGGQISGLSSCRFKTGKMPEESHIPPYDICELAHKAGASYCTRIIANGDFTGKLKPAILTRGFSLIEFEGLCPSYGYIKMKDLIESCRPEVVLANNNEAYSLAVKDTDSLFSALLKTEKLFDSNLGDRLEIIIAGSAGGGVQSAADILAYAGMVSGLNTTRKGEYPITVGTGFSVSEIIMSRNEINYTGIDIPDVAIIVTQDGLDKIKNRIKEKTFVVIDETLELSLPNKILKASFSKATGKKNAVMSAITMWLQHSNVFSLDALKHSAMSSKFSQALLQTIEKSCLLLNEKS